MRKCLILVFGFLFPFINLSSQTNLVSNGSFETFSNCPTGSSVIQYATGWFASFYSPDYYNSCSTSTTGFSTPTNIPGFQVPYSGQAYAGIQVYDKSNDGREVISSLLSSSLASGQKYFVSIRVNMADYPELSVYGINKLGVLFSTQKYQQTAPPPIQNFSHIYTNSIINDSLNWTLINGSFISDSNYNYINISNFFKSANTDTTNRNPNSTSSMNLAYYLVDDIRVSTDSLFGLGYVGIKEIEMSENLISIYPSPASKFLHINTKMDLKDSRIEIINELGQTVLKENFTNEIDVSGLANGVFILQIKNPENTMWRKRIVVSK